MSSFQCQTADLMFTNERLYLFEVHWSLHLQYVHFIGIKWNIFVFTLNFRGHFECVCFKEHQQRSVCLKTFLRILPGLAQTLHMMDEPRPDWRVAEESEGLSHFHQPVTAAHLFFHRLQSEAPWLGPISSNTHTHTHAHTHTHTHTVRGCCSTQLGQISGPPTSCCAAVMIRGLKLTPTHETLEPLLQWECCAFIPPLYKTYKHENWGAIVAPSSQQLKQWQMLMQHVSFASGATACYMK